MKISFETIILAVQVIIVALQLRLSWRINQQELSKNKGYFIPGATNLPHLRESEQRYRGKYDLRSSFPLDLAGNDAVSILSYKIELDGKPLIDTHGNYQPVFFVNERDLSSFECKLPLTEEHIKQRSLSITLILRLENTSGYRYIEKMYLGFEKDASISEWVLSRFNFSFSKKD